MDRQIRFHYDRAWTRWYSADEDLSQFRALEIDAVEISETMTRADVCRECDEHQRP